VASPDGSFKGRVATTYLDSSDNTQVITAFTSLYHIPPLFVPLLFLLFAPDIRLVFSSQTKKGVEGTMFVFKRQDSSFTSANKRTQALIFSS
jgi:hypothetical protein